MQAIAKVFLFDQHVIIRDTRETCGKLSNVGVISNATLYSVTLMQGNREIAQVSDLLLVSYNYSWYKAYRAGNDEWFIYL